MFKGVVENQFTTGGRPKDHVNPVLLKWGLGPMSEPTINRYDWGKTYRIPKNLVDLFVFSLPEVVENTNTPNHTRVT